MDSTPNLSYGYIKVTLKKGDLTKERTEAIVNAANSHLQHAGGLARAIVKNGGNSIQLDSDKVIKYKGKIHTGSCVATTAGSLPSLYVIHAVGPIWPMRPSKELERITRKLLKKVVRSVLSLASSLSLSSISIPPISGGIFGYPGHLCAYDILSSIEEVGLSYDQKRQPLKINLVIIDEENYSYFKAEVLKRSKKYLAITSPELQPHHSSMSLIEIREESTEDATEKPIKKLKINDFFRNNN